MSYQVVIPPAVEPITLDAALDHCNAEAHQQDKLISGIRGARAACEGLIQRPIIQRTVEQAFDGFDDTLKLEASPAVSVVSIKYTDPAGVEQTLSPAIYTLDSRSFVSAVCLAYNAQWPATRNEPHAVRVRYVAGLAETAAGVPADLRAWMLLTIAYLLAQREAFDMTGKAVAVPSRFVDSLLDSWRVYVV